LVILEVGKPRSEARAEVGRAVAILRYFSQQTLDPAGSIFPSSRAALLYSERRPHGVAGLITPWNFPVAIPLWKASPALAAGNAVLLKPSSDALACAQHLERVFAGLVPDNLFTVVPGDRHAATAIIASVDVVSFTGSTEVGRQVVARAAEHGIPVQAEMGGQNAAIVLPDADPEETAGMLVPATVSYAGQKCTATRRVIVVEDPAPLTDALAAALRKVSPRDPSEQDSLVGPVISESARAQMLAAVAEAEDAGGQILAGGRAVGDSGFYVEPTLIRSLSFDHRVAQEETFAPLAVILTADTLEDAVAVSNSVRHGLVTSIHGRDIERILRAIAAIDTGMVKVNAPTTGVDFHAPFGGEKDSSVGPREQGKAAMDFYSSIRTVTVAPGPSRGTTLAALGGSRR
jgi:aldehyde dehydrogenase (NAD+)